MYGVHGEGDTLSCKSREELEQNLNFLPDDGIKLNAQSSKTFKEDWDDDMVGNLALNARDKTNYQLNELSDEKDVKMIHVEADILKESGTECLLDNDSEHVPGEIDGLNIEFVTFKSKEKKGERWQSDSSPRDGMLSPVNGNIGHKSHRKDRGLLKI